MTEHHIAVPGGSLYVLDAGDPSAPAIVLMHAGIADLRSWADLTPLLVTAGYRVVAFDGRGFGRSTTEPIDFHETADTLAVLDALGIGRAAFVGNSNGGRIAFDTALTSPDRVVAIIGVAAGIGGFEALETPEEAVLIAEMDRLESMEPIDGDAVAEIDIRLWVDGPGQPTTRVPAALRELVRDMDFPTDWASRPEPRPIRPDPPAMERTAELRCPILLVVGALDVSSPAQVAAHIVATAPRARSVTVPGVAHMIGMEVPDVLARLITRFLEPLPRWS